MRQIHDNLQENRIEEKSFFGMQILINNRQNT